MAWWTSSLLVLAIAACAHRAQTEPLAVAIVAPVPRAREECSLHALPSQPVIVGFPSPNADSIYVSKSDITQMWIYQSAIAQWADDVTRCLASRGQVLP